VPPDPIPWADFGDLYSVAAHAISLPGGLLATGSLAHRSGAASVASPTTDTASEGESLRRSVGPFSGAPELDRPATAF
jgi:hypothetical protein